MKSGLSIVIIVIIVLTGCSRSQVSYYKRGVNYENKGKYAKALKAYRNSVKRDSTFALSYMGIGSVMVKNKRWEDALEYLLKANEIGITDQDIYMMIGQVYEALDNTDLAAEAYGKAIKARPEDALLHLTLGVSLEKNHEYEAALNEYNSAIAIAIDFPEAYFHSARMLSKLNRIEEAEETYLQAIKLRGKYVEAQNNLTVLFLNSQQALKAFESAKKSLEMDAVYVPGIVNMGIVHELMGNKKEAEEYYINAIKKDEKYDIAHFRLALFKLNDNKTAEAINELKLTLQYNPDFSPAYNEMGLLALENGEYEKALENLKKAVSLDSTYAIAYYNMGGVLANMGEYQEAAKAYNNYLIHAKTTEDSIEVLARINILMSAGKE